LIDTHAHINTSVYDEDRADVVKRAKEAGVESIIIPAIEPAEFDSLFETVEKFDNVYCGVGIHPHNANEVNEETINQIKELSFRNKVVAIGEIGLDYYYDFTPKEVQKDAFRKQIEIALERELPIIVHNRESDEDLLEILREEQNGSLEGVLHCFSSGIEVMTKAIDLGFHISFTGNITFKKSLLDDVVSGVPLKRLLLETDSPYMAPVPNRGKRNEPRNVLDIAAKISELKKISINEVIKMTTKNAKRLFRIMMLLALITILTMSVSLEALAQEDENDEFVNPYPKGLGFGFLVGTNTIVQNQYNGDLERSISYEGVFFWGGSVNLALFDWLMLEATYNYTKNDKIVEKSNNQEGPNINQVIELTSQWIANPYSRINFYGDIGFSFYYNTLNQGRSFETKDSPIGFNFGLGFKINIPVRAFGLFTPYLEWRLNWQPTKVNGVTYWDNIPIEIESTSFYSMPRLGVIFYPEALNFMNLNN